MSTLLIDSSFLIALQRKGVDARHALMPWLLAGELVTCAPITVEILRGIRDPPRRAQMQDFLDLIPAAPMDRAFWLDLAQLAWDLDRTGHRHGLVDLMIAQAALRAGATLVTHDRGFARIPKLKLASELPAR